MFLIKKVARLVAGSRRGRAVIAALVVAATVSVAAPVASASYVSVNKKDVWTSRSELATVADNFASAAQQARVAGGGCNAWASTTANAFTQAILYYKKFRFTTFSAVTSVWSHVVANVFGWYSGLDFCDIARKAAQGAAWATYYANQGGAWSWLYVYHETRTLRPDRCHMYTAWALPGQQYSWAVSDLVSGCKGD